MSNPNYPSPFPYPSYPPAEVPENEAAHGWTPTFTHPHSDMLSNLPESFPQDHSVNTKVPIPRSINSNVLSNRVRVSRACESCHDQKVKCSGDRPTCQRCRESGIQCSYSHRKREKMARRLDDLTARAQALEASLQNLYPNLDSLSTRYLGQVLYEQNVDNELLPQQPASGPASLSNPDPDFPWGWMDFTSEDFNRDEKIRAMGFVGEQSEISWLYRLKRALDRASLEGTKLDQSSITMVNFFLDDSEVIIAEDVDLFQRPPPEVANCLVDSYFQIVHPSFPIIGKVTFLGQYKSFYSATPTRPGKRWLAIMNLIFAITTKIFYHMMSDPESLPGDHLIYFSRAWRLSMRDTSLLDHPNLQQVQVEGLVSYYFMLIGQVNRSWRLCGMSTHSALAMGLNLRNESTSISHSSRESRYRVWWSLYMLQLSLSVIIGRLHNSTEDSCTTPLPLAFDEEDFVEEEVQKLLANHDARNAFLEHLSAWTTSRSLEPDLKPLKHQASNPGEHRGQVVPMPLEFLRPNTSLYFLYLVQLGLIGRRSVDALYAPGAARKSWSTIEITIAAWNNRVDSWLSHLPLEFHFTQGNKDFERERLSLAFHFYSMKILITQPCLSRLVWKASGTELPESFSVTTATLCVELAVQMLDILPETPNLHWVYGVSPWWFLVHYIMQSTTILFMSLFLKGKEDSVKYNQPPGVLQGVSRALDWLAEIGVNDLSAQRAWKVCRDILSQYEIGVVLDPRKSI